MSLMTRPSACTDALVLRTWDCGETSVIASLLTRDHGYVKVIAKAARQPRSRLRALVESGRLVTAEFGLDPGRELQYLRGGTVNLDPLGPGATLERTAFLLGALELVDRCRPRETIREPIRGTLRGTVRDAGGAQDSYLEPAPAAAPGLFAVCEEFVRVLSSPACRQPDLVFFGLEWELLARHGLAPALGVCAGCGRPLPEAGQGSLRFSPGEGGVICPGCTGPAGAGAGTALDRETWLILRGLGGEGAGLGDGPPLARAQRRQVGAILHGFLGYHLPGYRLPAALDLLRTRKD